MNKPASNKSVPFIMLPYSRGIKNKFAHPMLVREGNKRNNCCNSYDKNGDVVHSILSVILSKRGM